MRAVGKFIVVEKVTQENKTSNGLLLTSKSVNDLRYHKGVIISVGSEVDSLNEGETILFDKNAGSEILVDKDVRLVIRERDVVIVL